MFLKELQTGTVFNIENTPSYPKLKIDGGYVDIRDDIVNLSGNCDEKTVTIMYFGLDDIRNKVVNKLKEKYIK